MKESEMFVTYNIYIEDRGRIFFGLVAECRCRLLLVAGPSLPPLDFLLPPITMDNYESHASLFA